MGHSPTGDAGLDELGRIAAELATLDQAASQLRAARDTLLRELHAGGHRPGDLAHAARLSPERVSHLLGRPHQRRGRPPRRPAPP
ncbi:MAG: hypothetical protein AB7H92_17620 [Microbacteriaceae bacterium]